MEHINQQQYTMLNTSCQSFIIFAGSLESAISCKLGVWILSEEGVGEKSGFFIINYVNKFKLYWVEV